VQKIKYFLIIILCGLFLSGCASFCRDDCHWCHRVEPGCDTCANRLCAGHIRQIHRIEEGKVKVIQIGEMITFILPSDLYFMQDTPLLNPNYYYVLAQIACLIEDLPKYVVVIAGYTDSSCNEMRNVALTRQQAMAVLNFLWDQRIDSRVLGAVGYGSQNPIASNNTIRGRADNRRIEITLRLRTTPDDM
jgi:outer membrane protein OmpA-like peptidoglycan-associated protein